MWSGLDRIDNYKIKYQSTLENVEMLSILYNQALSQGTISI